VSFSDEERAELIGALTNAVLVADGLLEACRHLTKALEWKAPPTDQQIAEASQHLDRWREDVDKLKQRLASLTIEPPTREQ
jgi:ubiquinone biosynthesis protein UbiJ